MNIDQRAFAMDYAAGMTLTDCCQRHGIHPLALDELRKADGRFDALLNNCIPVHKQAIRDRLIEITNNDDLGSQERASLTRSILGYLEGVQEAEERALQEGQLDLSLVSDEVIERVYRDLNADTPS